MNRAIILFFISLAVFSNSVFAQTKDIHFSLVLTKEEAKEQPHTTYNYIAKKEDDGKPVGTGSFRPQFL